MKSKNTKRSIWERMKTNLKWISISPFTLDISVNGKGGSISILNINCAKFNRDLLYIAYRPITHWHIELLFVRIK